MVISTTATDSDENLNNTFASRYVRTALPRYVFFFSLLLSFYHFCLEEEQLEYIDGQACLTHGWRTVQIISLHEKIQLILHWILSCSSIWYGLDVRNKGTFLFLVLVLFSVSTSLQPWRLVVRDTWSFIHQGLYLRLIFLISKIIAKRFVYKIQVWV